MKGQHALSETTAIQTHGAPDELGNVIDTGRVGHVAVLRFSCPPDNYFSTPLIAALASAMEAADADPAVRAIVLASAGRNFCAGAALSQAREVPEHLYAAGLRLFAIRKPIVAAVQGTAVGGGLGLALVADFRVVSSNTRMSVNFVKIGIHPGFGTTLMLPRIVGHQKAAELFYTGRRLGGEEALAIGLADRMVADDALFDATLGLAQEIAANAPLAVEETRATLRAGLLDQLRSQTAIEAEKQLRLSATDDFAEGVRAVGERRPGNWQRR